MHDLYNKSLMYTEDANYKKAKSMGNVKLFASILLGQKLFIGIGNIFGHSAVRFFNIFMVGAFILANGIGHEFELFFRQLLTFGLFVAGNLRSCDYGSMVGPGIIGIRLKFEDFKLNFTSFINQIYLDSDGGRFTWCGFFQRLGGLFAGFCVFGLSRGPFFVGARFHQRFKVFLKFR